MRILLVSTQFPLPARDGASLRVLNLLRQLAASHQVVFCSLAPPDLEPALVTELESLGVEVHLVEHRRSPWARRRQIAAAALRREPYLVTINRSERLRRLVARLAGSVDLVQAEFPYGGQYLDGLSALKVLDQHNVESDIIRREAACERNPVRRLSTYLQFRKMRAFERRLCGAADLVLATSDDDADTLRRISRRVAVVPNGVERSGDAPADDTRLADGVAVTFTGLMSYRANIDAMAHFHRHVWPLVRTEGRRLVIVGRDPSERVRALAGGDVTVTGEVPDIRPYLNAATVFVAPLRIGSGTRIKILEAMAHGVPVVATPIGCLGIEAMDGRDILIAETPADFAGAVNRLLADPALRRRIGEAGRRLVENRYTWDAIGRRLNEVYGQWASVSSRH